MDPREVREALVEAVQEGFGIVASRYPIGELSPTLEELSAALQSLALCHLLEAGDTMKYRDNLARSAFGRRYFLTKSAQAGNLDDRRLALSRTEAFFDALAAGHGLLAREIAALSIDSWHAGWEYEDDFLYYHVLHRLVIDAAQDASPAELLERYEKAAEGGEPSARGAVVRALIERKTDAFSEALTLLMQQHDAALQERKEKLLEPDLDAFLYWPRTFICIEGLGLITIARAFGIEVAGDIPMCPTLARMPLSAPVAEDPFMALDALINAR
jgi:hypothetical protein